VSAHAVVVRDDRNREVVLQHPPQRIVSLLPSLTETVCVLGQCDKLVGVDRYSNWPQSVEKLPRLGGGIDPQLESVLALKPDLVLMATSARGADRLQALGLTVLIFEPRTYADVQRVLQQLALALGVSAKEGEALWRSMQDEVKAAAQTVPEALRGQRVYIEVSAAPYGASEGSFMGETLQRLGARNILPASMGPFPKVNPEFVVQAQPDLIMVGDSQLASMRTRPGWSNLRAMRAQRVCHFKPAQSDVLVRPGPRMGEGARLMAHCLAQMGAHGRQP
jgi:iron complex transport system substrate-binding protein